MAGLAGARFVDAHCHLGRLDDPILELRAAEEAGVVTLVVTESPSEFRRLKVALGRRALVRLAIGAHPLIASDLDHGDLELFERHVDETDYIGEVGLDFSREGKPTATRQVEVFEHVLALPATRQKLLSVHSRGAERETIDRLMHAQATAILHWYSGPLREIDRALDGGLYFSVNAAMLKSERGRRIIAAIPREHVLTETDAPFVRVGSRTSRPVDVVAVASDLGRLWGESATAVAAQVFENLARAYSHAHRRAADKARG